MADRFITVAIHTYEKAVALRNLLESEGIVVEFRNVNIDQPVVSSGVRVRIKETDLPLALRIIENKEIFVNEVAVKNTDISKPVVLPIDFSEKSYVAATTAFGIASKNNAPIVLLHTYIDPYVAGELQLTNSLAYEIADIDTREKIKQTANTQMRHFSDSLKDMIKKGELPPVPFSYEVVEGVPEDAITEYVRENTPSLIVMATRGPEKKEIDLIGSVTAEVLGKCRFSVLALPELDTIKYYGSDFKNILFFCNVDQQDILALDTLYRLMQNRDVKVTLTTLPIKKRPFAQTAKRAVDSLLDYCRNNFKSFTFDTAEVSGQNSEEEIRQIVKDRQFDLLAVPNKKQNIFSRLFNPTLAHRVLLNSDIPMLMIPV